MGQNGQNELFIMTTAKFVKMAQNVKFLRGPNGQNFYVAQNGQNF